MSNESLAAALMLGAFCGCGGASRDRQPGGKGADTTPNVAANAGRPVAGVKTVTRPATACEWLPVADVEAILGPLAGPPRGHSLSCRYPLPMDAETARRRGQYRSMLGPDAPGLQGLDLDKVEVIVLIDPRGNVTSERAGRIAGNMLTSMFTGALGKQLALADSARRHDDPVPPPGWDVARPPIRNRDFIGRIGHITVTVDENVPTEQAVSAEKKAALAALVRDRIPDLPFSYGQDDAGAARAPAGPDPCSLLSRDEAESVLGKLVVAPYRSHDGGPYAESEGSSCAYYTPGHRVLVVIPHWTDGGQDLRLVRGVGNLVSAVAADHEGEAADTLDGPWDDVALGLDGNIAFLKGDRLLEVKFATSSTDQAGALKLARIALERLAAAPAP